MVLFVVLVLCLEVFFIFSHPSLIHKVNIITFKKEGHIAGLLY